MKLNFKLNSKDITIEALPEKRLVNLLREDFSLLKVKDNCYSGICGNCTVIIDNKAVKSCLIPVFTIRGREIITLEGIENHDLYHCITEGLNKAECNPCNYCRPGKIMSIFSLLLRNESPEDEIIKEEIASHQCRCGSNTNITKAVLIASLLYKGMNNGR